MPKRLDVLDLARSAAVVCMIVWHALWDLEAVGILPENFCRSSGMTLLREAIAYTFILLAGISCRLSHNNLRRGLRLAACALLVTLATALVGETVWFGVLHLLAACTLLWAAFSRIAETLDRRWALAAFALFAVLRLSLPGVRVSTPGLFWLGLRTEDFVSADYYPLLPWLFLFLCGALAGRGLRDSDAKWTTVTLPKRLTWPGRHALTIYLLHQPLLYGIAALLAREMG